MPKYENCVNVYYVCRRHDKQLTSGHIARSVSIVFVISIWVLSYCKFFRLCGDNALQMGQGKSSNANL